MKRRRFMQGMAGVGWASQTAMAEKLSLARGLESVHAENDTSPTPPPPDYAALLAQHDVVYLSPTADPTECLPIGNGDMVAAQQNRIQYWPANLIPYP